MSSIYEDMFFTPEQLDISLKKAIDYTAIFSFAALAHLVYKQSGLTSQEVKIIALMGIIGVVNQFDVADTIDYFTNGGE